MGRDGRGRGENRGGDHEARGLQHGLGQGLRPGHLSGKNRAHFAKNYHHLQTDPFFIISIFSSCVFRVRECFRQVHSN